MLKRRPGDDDDLDESFDVAEREETDPISNFDESTNAVSAEDEDESDEVVELGLGDRFGSDFEYADDELEEEY